MLIRKARTNYCRDNYVYQSYYYIDRTYVLHNCVLIEHNYSKHIISIVYQD